MRREGEPADTLDTFLDETQSAIAIPIRHTLLYQGITLLPPRIREIDKNKPIPFSESVVAWAELFSACVDLFADPPPSLSQVRIRHLLDRLKSALQVYHENMAEVRNRWFLRDQELTAVQRNRAYRGFDYSPPIKSAMASLESEMRQTKVGLQNVVQEILFRILLEREKVVGTQLPTSESNSFANHGTTFRRIEA